MCNYWEISLTSILATIGAICVGLILLTTTAVLIQEEQWAGQRRLEQAVQEEVAKQLDDMGFLDIGFSENDVVSEEQTDGP